MKAKRVLSVLLAAMLLVSSFVLSASAEASDAIKGTKNCSLTITLLEDNNNDEKANTLGEQGTDTVTGDVTTISNPVYIDGAVFTIYNTSSFDISTDDDGNETITAKDGVTAQNSGQATTENGVVTFSGLSQGRYYVVNTEKAPTSTALYPSFYVDLPLTNVGGDGFIYDVKVYPKQVTTGAVEFEKTFNGSTTVPSTVSSVTIKLQKKDNEGNWSDDKTYSFTASDVAVIRENSLVIGTTYRFVESQLVSGDGTFDITKQTGYDKTSGLVLGSEFSITTGGYIETVTSGDTTTYTYYGTVVGHTANTTDPDIKNISDSTPVVDKKVAAVPASGTVTSYGNYANLSKDQKAEWKITASIPSDIAQYSKYVITDTVSDNLTIVDDSLKIMSGSTDLTKSSIFGTASFTNKTLTISVADGNFADLENYIQNGLIITYQTTINNNLAGVAIPNHVELTYNNRPSSEDASDDTTNNWDDPDDYDPDSSEPTPGSERDPYVYTGELNVLKKGSDNSVVAGAKFTLYDSDKSTVIDASLQTDKNGKFTVNGLTDGTYYLLETEAPAGYELYGDYIEVKIGENNALNADGVQTSVVVSNSKISDTVPIEIVDPVSTNLPLTGGMGVALFAGLGAVLVAVGGVLLFKKNKKADAAV